MKFWKSIVDYIKNKKEKAGTAKEPQYQNVQIKWDELTHNQCYDILYAIITNDRNLDIGRLKKKFPFVKYEVIAK